MTLIFSLPTHEPMAHELVQAGIGKQGAFSLERFANQEIHLTLQTPVANDLCILLGSITPPDINLLSLLVLSDTLKKEGAKKCIVLLPYLAYTRHEHKEPLKSCITSLIGRLFQASSIDQVITVDIHSKLAAELFPIPMHSLSPAKLFAQALQKSSWIPDCMIAPDLGAKNRCQEMANILGLSSCVAHMEKRRDKNGIIHRNVQGAVGKKALIVDDILDTAETLISCCQKLESLGTQEIVIMISHALFTGNRWKDLWKFPLRGIYHSNSIVPGITQDRVHVVSITPILEEYLCNLS